MAPQNLAYDLPLGVAVAATQYKGTSLAATIVASTGVFTTAAHGYAIGDRVVLSALASTTGLAVLTYYYVLTVPSSTTFTLSATSGGSALSLTTNGTATLAKLFEVRMKLANKLTSTSDTKTVNREGDNGIIKGSILQSIGFTFAQDAFPVGAHAQIYGITAVTSGLPDSYTNSYGLFGTNAEKTGKAVGMWFEAPDTQYDSNGTASSVTARYWYPQLIMTVTKVPELTTSDKPSAWEYSVNAADMSPTTDIMGVALPNSGAPLQILYK